MSTYFSIVSMGRSGSTFLARLLDSHPHILCYGEELSPHGLYSKHPESSIRNFIENILFRDRDTICGFKMPFDWILLYPDVFGAFRDLSFKLIHLVRRNKLDHFLSIKLAQQNGDWSSRQCYAHQHIRVRKEELHEFFITSEYADAVLGQVCSRFECLSIAYEELVTGQREIELLDHVGAEYRSLTADTVRARKLRREEAIENYGELVEAFSGTRFIHHFTAPEVL